MVAGVPSPPCLDPPSRLRARGGPGLVREPCVRLFSQCRRNSTLICRIGAPGGTRERTCESPTTGDAATGRQAAHVALLVTVDETPSSGHLCARGPDRRQQTGLQRYH